MKEVTILVVSIVLVILASIWFSTLVRGQTKAKRCTIEYITVSEPFVGRCRKIREGEYICRIVVCK